jgi:hypothetical protein
VKALAILAALLLTASCVTQKRCNAKFPPESSVSIVERIIQRDTILPATIVRDTVNLNDTVVIREMRTHVRVVRDSANTVEMRMWIDKYNNLQATCEALEKQVRWEEKHSEVVTKEVREKPPFKIPTRLLVLLALIVAGMFAAIRLFKK